MRDKAAWAPAIFCAMLSLITISGNVIVSLINRTSNFGGIEIVFYCFLPMCFYFVGAFLSHLQRENRELRTRIEELASRPLVEEHVA